VDGQDRVDEDIRIVSGAVDTNPCVDLCNGIDETIEILMPFVVPDELRAGFVRARPQPPSAAHTRLIHTGVGSRRANQAVAECVAHRQPISFLALSIRTRASPKTRRSSRNSSSQHDSDTLCEKRQ
jgi:hypothetical protein